MWGLAYGFAAAIQPGPFQTYLITQALHNGWRHTLPMALAPLLSDAPIIGLVLLLLNKIPLWWLQILRFLGGLFMIYLATGTLQAWRQFEREPLTIAPPPRQSAFRAALVNVLSPGPYIFWSSVTGPLLITGWHETPANGLCLLVGFFTTIVVCSAGLILLSVGAGKLGIQINRGLLGLSGIALVGFGVYQICTGFGVLWAGR